jgi:hypothetical protein
VPGRHETVPAAELREECRLFLEHLHPADGWGTVTVFSRPEERQRLYRPPVLAVAAAEFVDKEDLYVSVSRFRGRRGERRLLALGSLFVDLDYYHSRDSAIAGASPHEALTHALELLSRARLPAPTTAVSSGRGLALYWRHSYLPARAVPRWRACLKELRRVLTPLCPDPAVSDPSRVMRLPGTRNTRSGRLARLLLTPGEPYDFEVLTRALLPQQRHVIRRRNAGPTTVETVRAPRPGRVARQHVLDRHTLRRAKIEDLKRLLRHRHPDGVLPPGRRDHWMFAASTLFAFTVPFESLARVLVELGARVAGWTERETLTRMHATLRRAARAAAGEKDRRGGRTVDPRYDPGRAWFIEILGITEEEMRAADLRVLVGRGIVRERAAARQQDRRRSGGAIPRERYIRAARERRSRALSLHRAGQSYRQIAAVLSTTAEAARKLVSRALAAADPDTSVTGHGGPSALDGGSGGEAPRLLAEIEGETPGERPACGERCGKPAGFSKRAKRASACTAPARGG